VVHSHPSRRGEAMYAGSWPRTSCSDTILFALPPQHPVATLTKGRRRFVEVRSLTCLGAALPFIA